MRMAWAMTKDSNHHGFRLQSNPESTVNAFLDGASQGHNLGTTGAASIDQNQCLFVVNTGSAN